jgi:co-chaperonin GroES (HSP10)
MIFNVKKKKNKRANRTFMNERNLYDPTDPDDALYGSMINLTGIKPTGYKLLLEMPELAEFAAAKKAGLSIPDTVADAHAAAGVVAKVVQVAAGCYNPERYPEGPWCFPGDYVAMSPYNGTRIKSNIDGKDYRLVNEDSIDAVVVGPEYVKRG